MDVRVVVTKTFEYRGRTARRGSSLAMTPIDAAVAARKGEVTLVAGAKVAPDPDEPPRRRRYRTRHLTAQE